MNKLITIAFGVACATALALSASATTYYYVGNKSEPAFKKSPNGDFFYLFFLTNINSV